MKRAYLIGIAVLAAVVLVSAWAATNPRGRAYSPDGGLPRLDRIDLLHLTDEEEALLVDFAVRMSTSTRGAPTSMTIGEAIAAQREFNRLSTLLPAR